MATANRLVIRNEQEAFDALRRALEGEIHQDLNQISFENWPVLTISLTGNGYDSSITADMAEGIVALQAAMHRSYARLVYGATNARKLTIDDRASLQFKAKVRRGSSVVEVNLTDFAQKLGLELMGKMTGPEIVTAVVGVAAVAGSYLGYKAYLKHRTEDKTISVQAERDLAMSREETRRLEVMARVVELVPAVRHASGDFDDARMELVKGGVSANTVTLNGIQLSADDARKVASSPRVRSEDVQLNGTYLIQKIDWRSDEEERAILSVENVVTRQRFSATLRTAGLQVAQKEILQAAEWERRQIYLSINANVLRGEVTAAAIVNVAWPQS